MICRRFARAPQFRDLRKYWASRTAVPFWGGTTQFLPGEVALFPNGTAVLTVLLLKANRYRRVAYPLVPQYRVRLYDILSILTAYARYKYTCRDMLVFPLSGVSTNKFHYLSVCLSVSAWPTPSLLTLYLTFAHFPPSRNLLSFHVRNPEVVQ